MKHIIKRALIGSGAIMAVLVVLAAFTSKPGAAPPTQRATATAVVAKTITQQHACAIAQVSVEDALKSPSSAQFPICTATLKDGAWDVMGYVDAKNSFGVSLRSTYIAHIDADGGNAHVSMMNGAD